MVLLTAIILGFILDFIFGDPRWLPHPICFIGKLISVTEKAVRRFTGEKPEGLLMGGFVLVVIVLGVSFAVPYFILHFAEMYSPVLAFVIETFMFYQIFAMRSLKEASMQVCEALRAGDLPEARKKLSWIVGRDTAELTEEEVAKAAVETVAENTVDGIISPLFFFFIGGLPLAVLYRAANTMDAMLGYKNDKYLYFGRTAARVDDVLNFIPARITGILLVITAFFQRFDYKNALKMMLRDAKKHPSPNGGYSEATVAGALNIRLGGINYYFGRQSFRAYMGDDTQELKPVHIMQTIKMMYGVSIFFVVICSVVPIIIAKYIEIYL